MRAYIKMQGVKIKISDIRSFWKVTVALKLVSFSSKFQSGRHFLRNYYITSNARGFLSKSPNYRT